MLTLRPALTLACSVAKLTLASLTPAMPLSAFSTRATHDAQVMPSTGKRHSVTADSAVSGRWGVGKVCVTLMRVLLKWIAGCDDDCSLNLTTVAGSSRPPTIVPNTLRHGRK